MLAAPTTCHAPRRSQTCSFSGCCWRQFRSSCRSRRGWPRAARARVSRNCRARFTISRRRSIVCRRWWVNSGERPAPRNRRRGRRTQVLPLPRPLPRPHVLPRRRLSRRLLFPKYRFVRLQYRRRHRARIPGPICRSVLRLYHLGPPRHQLLRKKIRGPNSPVSANVHRSLPPRRGPSSQPLPVRIDRQLPRNP